MGERDWLKRWYASSMGERDWPKRWYASSMGERDWLKRWCASSMGEHDWVLAGMNISGFPPVLRDWVIKGLIMCSRFYATGHIKVVYLTASRREAWSVEVKAI